MKQKNNFHAKCLAIAFLIAVVLPVGSCDSFVEVDLPKSQLTGPSVFVDRTTADAAMAEVYASIRDQGMLSGTPFGLSHEMGAYGDELDFYGDASFYTLSFYNNSLLPTTAAMSNYWNVTYNQIYAANSVYRGVQASTTLPPEDRDRLMGESLFVRALLHFYLINTYGEIPYIRTTDYQLNRTVMRTGIAEAYNLLLEDIEQAITLLDEDYYGPGRARPNKSTAMALMSRVHLYNGSWAEAANTASAILNNTALYADEPNIENLFLRDCTENIWQLPPAMEGRNTDEAITFTLFAGPPQTAALTAGLVGAFEPGDIRRTAWIGEVSAGTDTWYYARKYKQVTTEAESSEYAVVFRLAEQYLIRAEARARQGELTGAKEDLDRIRQRSGLAATAAIGQQQILDAIISERRFEFFTEYGHRFFDLKRNGTLDAVLQLAKPGWDTHDRLFPIPQSELGVNPNLLPQNPGY